MLDQLMQHYKDAITTDLSKHNNYIWFQTADRKPFGIKGSVLSEAEKQLLSSLFETYANESQTVLSPVQKRWKLLLSGSTVSFPDIHFYRFIHFFSKQPVSDYSAFAEAVSGLFSEDTVFLLHDDHKSGLIIETSKEEVDATPYDALKDMLSTDFYIDVSIYIGSFNQKIELAKETFEREQDLFLKVKYTLPPQSVYTFSDVIPYHLLQSADASCKNALLDLLHDWSTEDRETLNSIKVFIEHNMNASSAAKALYVHRNSLQYRVDKFFEKTGIDVKQFKNALTVYMAILTLEQNMTQ